MLQKITALSTLSFNHVGKNEIKCNIGNGICTYFTYSTVFSSFSLVSALAIAKTHLKEVQ